MITKEKREVAMVHDVASRIAETLLKCQCGARGTHLVMYHDSRPHMIIRRDKLTDAISSEIARCIVRNREARRRATRKKK